MIFQLENGQLTTDLDCQFNSLINVGAIVPIPAGLVADDDPRLSDDRNPLDGSVTNVKVAVAAGIVQSKLNLNGVIPVTWLGNTSTTAAQGNLAEYVSRKAVANGYASLDATGKIPVAQLPALAGVGTVTSIGLAMPGQFSVTGTPVTTTGTISVAWASAPAVSWFGNPGVSAAVPGFKTTAVPLALIPNLPASQVTSGLFLPAQLPVAVYGLGHAKGAVPDPGDTTGDPTDYLARNMTFKPSLTSAKVSVITTVGASQFNTDAGVRAVFVELWGGGAGGGGAVATSGNCAAGSGGGGGAYVCKWITVIQGFYNVIVGGGGAGGSTGGGGGNPGGPTSWAGGPPLANGGAAGNGDNVGNITPGVVRAGGFGGAPGGGVDMGMSGGDGGDAIRWDGTHGRSGDGGEAAIGGGGAKGRSGEGAGTAGNNYGGGGAGALSFTVTGYGGGAGGQGVIRVTQYF